MNLIRKYLVLLILPIVFIGSLDITVINHWCNSCNISDIHFYEAQECSSHDIEVCCSHQAQECINEGAVGLQENNSCCELSSSLFILIFPSVNFKPIHIPYISVVDFLFLQFASIKTDNLVGNENAFSDTSPPFFDSSGYILLKYISVFRI
jgi:hypothetical protein